MSRSLTPQNPLTTNTISVSSSAGFSAGDLVYQKSGDVGVIPNGLAPTGNFNITGTVGTIPASNVANNATVVGVSGALGGGAILGAPQAAKLSNGNIVVVYMNPFANYRPYYRIIDENNTEILAETAVSSSYTSCPSTQPICVAAVTNGFVITWLDSSNYICTIIYANNGTTVITSVSQDTTNVMQSFSTVSKPDGGYVIIGNDSNTGNARFRAFSATGVASFAWTSIAAYNSSQRRSVIAVRSDNSFLAAVMTSATNIGYYVYNSAGVAGTTGTLTTSASTTGTRLACAALANDDVIFFYTVSGPDTYRRRVLAANTLGAETSMSIASYGPTGVQALTGGGYIVALCSNSLGQIYYAIYNSADTNLYGTKAIIGMGAMGTNGLGNNAAILQLASNIAIIGTYTQNTNYGYATAMAQVVTATGALRIFTTSSLTTGTVSSTTNAYAKGSSTPNAAYFAAATSTTLTQSIPVVSGSSSYVVSPTIVDSTVSCNNAYPRMMQNGQIVIGYAYSSGGNTVKFAVYSTSGTFVATYTVATSNSSSSIVRMCVLGNGKLVIAWGDSSNNIKFAVYSTSYTLLTSGTTQALFAISPSNANSASEGFDVAALSDIDRFVLSYSNGSQTCSLVINDALSLVNNTGITGNSGYYSNKVCALASGGYVLLQQYNSLSTGTYVSAYYKTSATAYSQATNFSLTGDNVTLGLTNTITMTPQGVGLAYIPQGSASGQLYTVDLGYRTGNGLVVMSTSGSTSQGAVTTLASGALVAVRMDINTSQYYVYVYSPTGTGQHLANAISGLDQNATTPIPTLAPTFDSAFICAYRNSSGYPIFFVGSTVATSYSTSIIAGTTLPNAPGYLPSQANGYIFKGVATTTAPAGGSGVVQNIGSAQLNSSYPAGTTYQAFDSTGTLVQGTKGTITGRNVNMTGTS